MTAPSDVSVIDINLGTPIASIPALEGGPFAVSPDGTRLYRSSPRSVDVFDTYGNAIDTFTVTVTDGYGGTTSHPVQSSASHQSTPPRSRASRLWHARRLHGCGDRFGDQHRCRRRHPDLQRLDNHLQGKRGR